MARGNVAISLSVESHATYTTSVADERSRTGATRAAAASAASRSAALQPVATSAVRTTAVRAIDATAVRRWSRWYLADLSSFIEGQVGRVRRVGRVGQVGHAGEATSPTCLTSPTCPTRLFVHASLFSLRHSSTADRYACRRRSAWLRAAGATAR